MRIEETTKPIPVFRAFGNTVQVYADGLREIVLIKYKNPLHADRDKPDSFTLPRDRALIGQLADAFSLLERSDKMWTKLAGENGTGENNEARRSGSPTTGNR